MDTELKYCNKCVIGKPNTVKYFSMRSDTGKLNSQCKECKSKKRQEYYLLNIEKSTAQNLEWKQNNKEKRKKVHEVWYENNKDKVLQHSRDMYHQNIEAERIRNKKYRDSHKEDRNKKRCQRYKDNPEKEKEKMRDWYNLNKDKHLSNGNKWRKNNRDKAVRLLEKYRSNKISNGGVYSERDVNRIYGRQMGKCFYCGIEVNNKYHIDHIIPLSKGGSNYCGNILISCPSCNSSKSNKLLIEWIRYKKKINANTTVPDGDEPYNRYWEPVQ